MWKKIDELIDRQEYRQALGVAEALLSRIREGDDSGDWTRALIQVAQLETGLHGYETAVRRLRREDWPEDPLSRTALTLYYAQGLAHYLSAYSWEIDQRERVAAGPEVGLGAMTGEQIYAAAQQAYAEIWAHREVLGRHPIDALARYVEANDYPAGIRDTLRDALTYFWVELLADSSRWSAREGNDLFLLDLESLVDARPAEIDDPVWATLHPFEKLVSILADLEDWHRSEGRLEAALEARLTRLRQLRSWFSQEDDRGLLRAELERLVAEFDPELDWWSVAVFELADLVQEGDNPWRLVEAREIALRGASRHPESFGGKRCRHLVATIEAPSYSLTTMSTDGLGKRSIEVRHRNLERLHFRAYPVDLLRRVESSRDYNLLPERQEIEEIAAKRRPTTTWSSDLGPTPDYRQHRTFVTPEIDAPGFYLVVASAEESFSESETLLQAAWLNLSDLVLLVRHESSSFDVTVRSGESGLAVADAEVALFRYDYGRRGHHEVERRRTDGQGRVRFGSRSDRARYFLIAEAESQLAFDPAPRWWREPGRDRTRRRALVYTDRSVYRPGQEILWKTVAYQGRRSTGRFETLSDAPFSVELVDANGEIVETLDVESNDFGSVSGRFEIPTGRLLGRWRVRASLGGAAEIRVEEYKRPTFTVDLVDPDEPLRLNREATFRGQARYYFGLPLVEGDVRWRVTRVPVYPRWWSWWYGSIPDTGEQTVASGTASLSADGDFSLDFLPVADERKAGSGVSFRYRVNAEVTDIGGETRTVERTFRLGFVAVEATLEADSSYFEVGEAAAISVRRTDLDGTPRVGVGSWRLVALDQPPNTVLPADLPLPRPPREQGKPEFRTAGDGLRPRWSSESDSALYLRSWSDGREIVRGDSRHGSTGVAEIRLPRLAAGAYRLYYSTEDPFGARYETQRELVVVDRDSTDLAVPLALWPRRSSVSVGGRLQLFVHSGLEEQDLVLELFHRNRLLERRVIRSSTDPRVIEIEIAPEHQGGIGARLTGVRDHQLLTANAFVLVPWDDRVLDLSFSTFRDRIKPGDVERWVVTVKADDGRVLEQGSAELLAYMYDRSLDLFAPHQPSDPLQLYPSWGGPSRVEASLGPGHTVWQAGSVFAPPEFPVFADDRLEFLSGYGIGGMGRRMMRLAMEASIEAVPVEAEAAPVPERAESRGDLAAEETIVVTAEAAEESPELRRDFSETAFWEPHLRLDPEGSVSFEFTVPDSLTEWNVWVHALTRDLKSGRLERRTVSSKELMVRPYLPRFLREGDRVEIRVVVNNAGPEALEGVLDVALEDRESGEDLFAEFGVATESASGLPFRLESGGGESFPITLDVPPRLGEIVLRAEARAGEWSDGELRALPLLPGRMHLIQSRFAALQDKDRRQLHFADMVGAADPSMLNEQLVVTLDGQLFYAVLHALPYLASYPYECTEQTLNRFLSTGIVSTVYDRYPAVERLAKRFSERETRFETWDSGDPNRAMSLEETPWLRMSRGGSEGSAELINVLDSRIARGQRKSALAKLEKSQTAIGGFPWWPGGPPSPHMTLYLLSGLSRALEFDIEVPKPMVRKAWEYLHRHYIDEIADRMLEKDCCWELVTFLHYVLSSYPDESWTGGLFSGQDRERMLDFSFANWQEHSPLLKGYLTLTLLRAGRAGDANLVFDSVMDSAITELDLGTYWAPEDRAWLWYNDTIESHAFALRVLTELDPEDERRHGLVHWLFLNKKLNHWKSTRATAEVIYSLVHYLDYEGTLAAREAVDVTVGERPVQTFVFEPDEYAGDNRQIVLGAEEIDAATDGNIVIEKETPGLLFASATWHFSTDRLPEEASGDFFSVERDYFRRSLTGDEWTLEPLAPGARLEVGDQIEVHLSIRAKHAAEYVHLRDPRPAGFEPETLTSGYSWKLGLPVYEEVRDSGANFFFEWLPAGEYALKYRLRANLGGTFKAAPAQLQSMYAPEFVAYSAGDLLQVGD